MRRTAILAAAAAVAAVACAQAHAGLKPNLEFDIAGYYSSYSSHFDGTDGDRSVTGGATIGSDGIYLGATVHWPVLQKYGIYTDAGFLSGDDVSDTVVVGAGAATRYDLDLGFKYAPRQVIANAGLYIGQSDDFDLTQLRLDVTGHWPCEMFGGVNVLGGLGTSFTDVDPEVGNGDDQITIGPLFYVNKTLREGMSLNAGVQIHETFSASLTLTSRF